MSTQLSGESFLAVVQKSGLVDNERLKRSAAEFQTQGGDATNATALAEHFVTRSILSKWQAEKLLLGKHKGYFLGKYRLISLLGKGGMSSVYLAEHTLMKRRCAIKVLPTKRVGDSSYLARFHREAQAVAALDHPNIVRAYDVDHQVERDGEIHFLVMEYVDGSSLQEWVAKAGKLGFVEAVDSIRQAAVGLAHAHAAGLVHRDIKPGNLLCDPQGTVKILDLGLARFFDNQGQDEALTIQHDEKVLGTADYLAPEQALDSHSVDARADIYSLGCTLYFLLTGHPPFTEGTLTQRLMAHQTKEPPALEKERPDTPESLAVIVRKMMAKKADDRYASANDTAEALRKWLGANAPADWKKAHSGLFANDVTRATAVVAAVVAPKKEAPAPAAPSVAAASPKAPPAPASAEPELAAFFAGMADNPPAVAKSPSSIRLKAVPPQPPTPAKSPSSIKTKTPVTAPQSAVLPAPPPAPPTAGGGAFDFLNAGVPEVEAAPIFIETALATPPVAAPPVVKAAPVKAAPVKAAPVPAAPAPPVTPSPAPPATSGGGAFDFLNVGSAAEEAAPVLIDTAPASPPVAAPPVAKAAPVKATPVKAPPVKAAPATPVAPPAVGGGAFDFLNAGVAEVEAAPVMIDTAPASPPMAAPPVVKATPVKAVPFKAVPPASSPPVPPPAPVAEGGGAFDFLNAPSAEVEAAPVVIQTTPTASPVVTTTPVVTAATAPVVAPVVAKPVAIKATPVKPVVPVAAQPASTQPVSAPPVEQAASTAGAFDFLGGVISAAPVPPDIATPAAETPVAVPAVAPPTEASPSPAPGAFDFLSAAPAEAAPTPFLIETAPAVSAPTPVAAPAESPAPVSEPVAPGAIVSAENDAPTESIPASMEPAVVADANPFAFTPAPVPTVAVAPAAAVAKPVAPSTPAAAPPADAGKAGGPPKIALIGGGAAIALLLVGGLGYALGWFGGSKPVVKKSNKAKSSKVAANDADGAAKSNSPWKQKRSATVGPAGDFKTLNEALQIVKQHFVSQIRSDRFTIKLTAGTYPERIVIDGKTWPANIHIEGEGTVILEPSGADPVVQLSSVEGVQLRGLTVKAGGKPVAVQLTGNMARVKLQKVTIDGFTEAGLALRGAAGLSFSDARCQFEEVTIQGGGASGVGVKATKHDDVDPSNLVFTRCRFIGPLAAGVSISAKDATAIEFRESIFHATTVGVHLLNKSSWRDDVFVQNTFHQCGHGILIAEQPEISSKGMSLRRNLFIGTKTAEIQVEKGFDEKLLLNNQMLGPIGQNWSDRPRPEKPVGEIAIFGADSQAGRTDLKLATTDPANAKFLAPAAGSPHAAPGGQGAGEKAWIGAVGP